MHERSQTNPAAPLRPVTEVIGMDAHSRKIVLCHMRRVGDAIGTQTVASHQDATIVLHHALAVAINVM